MRKKLLSVLLTCAVVLSLLPASVLAETEPTTSKVVKAPLADEGYVKEYALSEADVKDGYTSYTLTARDLKKHENGAPEKKDGYWVGVGFVPEGEGSPTESVSYKTADTREGLDSKKDEQLLNLEADIYEGKSGIAFYVDAEKYVKSKQSLWISINWTDTADTVEVFEIKFDVTIITRVHTITFDANGGKLTGSETATTKEDGRLDNMPSKPIRDGYDFDAWYTAKDGGYAVDTTYTFTKDTVIYAHWTENESKEKGFTVTFNANGGLFEDGSKEVKAKTNEKGILEQNKLPTPPSRTGHAFAAWWYTAEGEDGKQVNWTYAFAKDTAVYAHWTKQDDTGGGGDNTGGGGTGGDNTGGGGTGGDNTGGDNTGGGNTSGGSTGGDSTGGAGNEKTSYAIQIASGLRHGKISTTHTSAEAGTWVTITVNPDTDYALDWVEVEQENGRLVSLSQSGRRYSFTMPASDVTINAKFSLLAAYNTFIPPQSQKTIAQTSAPALVFTPITWRPVAAMWDVPASSWAYPAARWAYQNGYLDTVADGSFRLNDTVSHLQMWRIMARWLGEPAIDDSSVSQWASRSGAARVGGASAAMTRQNVVEYLYQCYFLMGGDVSATGNLIQYRDSQQITSVSAKNAWIWAVNKGIISGTPDGYLNPGGILSRGEFASILMRLCQG